MEGLEGLFRRDFTASLMLLCATTDPMIISNTSVFDIQSIYLPRCLSGRCGPVGARRKAPEDGGDEDEDEDALGTGEDEDVGKEDGEDDEVEEEEVEGEAEEGGSGSDRRGEDLWPTGWLRCTIEPEPITLRLVMVTEAALMMLDLRGLPGPGRVCFSRMAAASPARARSCFSRCACLLSANSFSRCCSASAASAALASALIADTLG
jgi:hypothetical protein